MKACSWVATAAVLLPVSSLAAHTMQHRGATPNIATQSAVFVERLEGKNKRRLEAASTLSRGDRVVTVLTWYRMGGNDSSFVITNPLPPRLAFQRSANEGQEVSVDNGRTWGKLEDLRLGARSATPEDVTHVRWRIPARTAARGRGQIAFAGIVR